MPSDDVTPTAKAKVRVNISGGQEPNSVPLFSGQTFLRLGSSLPLGLLCTEDKPLENKDQQD